MQALPVKPHSDRGPDGEEAPLLGVGHLNLQAPSIGQLKGVEDHRSGVVGEEDFYIRIPFIQRLGPYHLQFLTHLLVPCHTLAIAPISFACYNL